MLKEIIGLECILPIPAQISSINVFSIQNDGDAIQIVHVNLLVLINIYTYKLLFYVN